MKALYFNDKPGMGSSRVIFLGSVYLLLGIFALAFASATSLVAIITLGMVLIGAGIAEIVYGLQGRKRGQLWPHLAFGSLALICGALVLMNPVENTLGFTLIAGFLLVASGLAKVIGSLAERSTGWGWFATNGIISIILGGFILRAFPISAFWTIGVFVGIDLIVAGASLIGLGASAKRAKRELVGQAYSTLNPEPGPRSESDRGAHPFH
jgi:uncharacterized membrane protein HdeD (DUF308 family)